MKTNHILQFYQILRKDSLCFVYHGDFSDGITEKIISLSEHSIDNTQEMAKIKNKVSLLIVECFQNIVRHGNETHTKTNRTVSFPGLFSTRNSQGSVYIASANLIENKQIENLKEKLEKINHLDKEQIRELYSEILAKGDISSKGGAGLGLVEMARKSGNPIEYSFENVTDKHSSFYLMLKMQGLVPTSSEKNISMEQIKHLHDTMRKENILMVYKGDFSQDTIIPLLKMIEDNLNKQMEELNVKKKLYFILVEILQNISKHSLEQNGVREAIFMIGKSGQKYTICSGNLVDTASAEKIKNKINQINSLNKEELKSLYKKTLKEGASTEKGAGLGIIDIARESSEKLVFDLIPEDENSSFYSLSVLL